MTLKPILLTLSFGIFVTATAWSQKDISIKDPEITFGYTLPQGFANEDDSFFHYVFPEIENGLEKASLRLTYFEGFDGELSDFKDGILNGKLYSTLEDFKIKNSGKDIIDGTLALWSTYSYTEEDIQKCGELYCFKRIGQYFEIHIQANCSEYAEYEKDLKNVLSSLKVTRN